MSDRCDFAKCCDGSGERVCLKCDRCGRKLYAPKRAAGSLKAMCGVQRPPGPGHHLAHLLSEADRWLTFARWFPGLQAYSLKKSAGCGCAEMARQMDAWGPQGCRDNMTLILDHLREEAKERGIRFIETVARMLVREAIRRAEK